MTMHHSEVTGIVHLVGAGPGHPDLITRQGYDLLQHCDAVAYDALIPLELIVSLPERIEKYYVGKRAGKHCMPQSEINRLLAGLARRGLDVVRLKGGDPSIFGRSGEEAEYLAEAGIPVVISPGVTAASAAAAFSGFSLTHRHAASWLFMGTGHGAEGSESSVPWRQAAALKGGTLVVYMGLSKLDRVVSELLATGLEPETPAIVVQAVSTGMQQIVETTLVKLTEECERRGVKPPALVVIGEAVRNRLSSYRAKESLAGKRVLVTCPSQDIPNICKRLRASGAEPVTYPTITRRRVDDVAGWARFEKLIDQGGICLFLNPAQVGLFVEELVFHALDLRSLARFKIIAMDGATAAALLERGVRADLILNFVEQQNQADTIQRFIRLGSPTVVWVRGDLGQSTLEARLQQLGVNVMPLTVSLDSVAEWDAYWKEDLEENPPDFITFTSTSEVEGFVDLLGAESARRIASKVCIASGSKTVTGKLREYGLALELEASNPTIEALVCALNSHSEAQVKQF